MVINLLPIFLLLLFEGAWSMNSQKMNSLTAKQLEILQLIEAWKSQCDSLKTRISGAIDEVIMESTNINTDFEKTKNDVRKWYGDWLNDIKQKGNLSPIDREQCIRKNSPIFFNIYNNIDNTINACLEHKTKNILERLRVLANKADEMKLKFKQCEIFVKNCLVYVEKLNDPDQNERCLDEEAAKAKSYGDELEQQLSKNTDQIISSQPSHQELEHCLANSNGEFLEVILIIAGSDSISEIRLCIKGQDEQSDDSE